MIRVRSNSDSPLVIGAVRLDARGAEGAVDLARPGVRGLIDAGRLVVIEGDASLPSAADELAAARAENTRLVAENEALKADVVRLNALNEGLRMADRPKPVDVSVSIAPGASSDAVAAAVADATSQKPAKKGG